ncbi:MAG TPA: fibronectin type III domain-containing protein [Streptosporangiaceae bacterium]
MRTRSRAAVAVVVALSLLLVGGVTMPAWAGPKPHVILPGPYVADVFPGDGSVTVSWAPPDWPADTAADITGYEVDASPGGASVTVGANSRGATVDGLTNGQTYTFTVQVISDWASAPSAPSAPVIPQAATAPGAPLLTAVVGRDSSVVVSWSPGADGGAAVTGYRISADPGGAGVSAAASATSATLAGLANGTPYRISVQAINKAGAGAAAVSDPVVPAPVHAPGAPQRVSAMGTGSGSVRVWWQPPVDDGGAAVSGYQVVADPGGATQTTTGTAVTMTGLDPDTAYTFTVTATNAAGTGPAGSTPRAVHAQLAVSANTVVLSGQDIAALTAAHSDGTLDFTSPPADITALTAGKILVAATSGKLPAGFLGQVTGVTSSGSNVTVTTKPAALKDAVSVDVAAAADIDGGDLLPAGNLPPGVSVHAEPAPKATHELRGLAIDWKLHAEYENHIKVNGTVRINASLTPYHEESIDIRGGKADLTGGVKSHLSVTGNLTAVGEFEKELKRIHFVDKCYTFLAGPVPIVVCVRASVALVISGSGTAAVDFSLVQGDKTLGGHVHISGHDVSADKVNTGPGWQGPRVQLTMNGKLHLELPVTFEFLLYDEVGAAITVGPYAEFRADLTQTPWGELYVGVRIGIAVVGNSPWEEDSVPLWQREDICDCAVKLWDTGGPYHGLVIDPMAGGTDPGQSVQFTARPVGLTGQSAITWKVTHGPGDISTTGLYTAADDPPRAWAEITASTQAGGTTYTARAAALVGAIAPDPPLYVTARPALGGALVSWVPPDNDDDVAYYVIHIIPDSGAPTSTVTADGTSTTISLPFPGQRFSFEVAAAGDDDATSAFTIGNTITIPDRMPRATTSAIFPPGDITDDIWHLSGDGSRIFYSTAANTAAAPPEVHGTDDQNLIADTTVFGWDGTDPTVNPNRISLVATSVDGHDVFADRTDGVSTDGNIYLFHDARDIGHDWYIHNMRTGDTHKISTTLGPPGEAVLNSEGTKAALSGYPTEDGVTHTYIQDTADPGATPVEIPYPPCDLYPDAGTCDNEPESAFGLSADGTKVFYNVTSQTRPPYTWCSDIYEADIDNGTAANLTHCHDHNLLNYDGRAVSADGSTILYETRTDADIRANRMTLNWGAITADSTLAGHPIPGMTDIQYGLAGGYKAKMSGNGRIVVMKRLDTADFNKAYAYDAETNTVTPVGFTDPQHWVGDVQVSDSGTTIAWSAFDCTPNPCNAGNINNAQLYVNTPAS